ncbi:MAG: winged helix-turn-helix domain-containing protein, partial [Acidimicrobiales bacterium]
PDGSAESGHYVRVYIQQIRRKLGDNAADPTFIATEMSYGYRWLPRPIEVRPLILMPS